MAFGRLERTARPKPIGEINMTPLIDVMLVLLAIFMVGAPLLGSSLKLDLPRAAGAAANDRPEVLEVALDRDGRLHLDDRPIDDDAFSARAAERARAAPRTELQLRADRAVPYGRVAEVLGRAQQAGLNRIGFVTEPPAPSASPRATLPARPGR